MQTTAETSFLLPSNTQPVPDNLAHNKLLLEKITIYIERERKRERERAKDEWGQTVGTPLRIGSGWASVFSTHESKGSTVSSLKRRKRYFRVSAMKKLCCTSSLGGCSLYTSLTPE